MRESGKRSARTLHPDRRPSRLAGVQDRYRERSHAVVPLTVVDRPAAVTDLFELRDEALPVDDRVIGEPMQFAVCFDERGEVLSGECEDRLAHRRDVPRDAGTERPREPQWHVGFDLQHHDRVVAVEDAERAGLMGDLGEQFELRARGDDPVPARRRGEQQQRIGPDSIALGRGVVGKQPFAHERREDPMGGRRVQLDRPRHVGERQRCVGAREEPQDRDPALDRLCAGLLARADLGCHALDCRTPRAAAPAGGIGRVISRHEPAGSVLPIRRRAVRTSGCDRGGRA